MSDTATEPRERAPFKLDIGRIGLIIVLPVVLWAYYTTASGMVDIMGKGQGDYVGLIGAMIGSAAVLVLLALTSWSLGTDLAALLTRQRGLKGPPIGKVLLIGLVFVFVFSISAFFSFTYYYNNIFGLSTRTITNEQMPTEMRAEVLGNVEKSITAAYEEQTKKILASPGATAYLAHLDTILKVAGTGGENFRKQVSDAQAATAARQGEIRQARIDAADLDGKIAAIGREIADLNAIISPRQDEINDLTTKRKLEEQLAVDSEVGRDKSGRPGCREICMGHKAAAAKLAQDIRTIEGTIAKPLRDRADRTKARDALVAQRAELQAKIDASEPAAPANAAENIRNATETLHLLEDGRNKFKEDPSSANLARLKPHCELVLRVQRQLKMVPAEVPSNFECEPLTSDVREMLTARNDTLRGQADYNKMCRPNGELGPLLADLEAKIRIQPQIDGLTEAKKLIDRCIVQARSTGLSEDQIQLLLRRSNEFARDNDAGLNKFAKARKAFWAGTADSSLAITVAVVQDTFILILKLLSDIFGREARAPARAVRGAAVDVADRDHDAPEVRATKAILRCTQPVRNDASELAIGDASLIVGLPSDVQDNVRALANRLVRQGNARLDRRGNYLIDNSALRELEADIREMQRVDAPQHAISQPPVRRSERSESPARQAAGEATAQGEAAARSPVRRPQGAALREYLAAGANAAPEPQSSSRTAKASNTQGAAQAAKRPTDADNNEVRFDRLRARRQSNTDT